MSFNRLQSTRRYTIHVPQLVGRVSYPQHSEQSPQGVHEAMRRLVSEYDTAMAELQNFLKYLQSSSDEVVTEGGFYPGVPEVLNAAAGDAGDPTQGWSAGPHRHQIEVGPVAGLGNANSNGIDDALARADHVHKRDVRAKHQGVDVATRNAYDFRNTPIVTWALTDDVANDEVDVQATPGPDFVDEAFIMGSAGGCC